MDGAHTRGRGSGPVKLLVVGVSYRTAPVGLIERIMVASRDVPEALRALLSQRSVEEAAILVTCNRVEIYAGVSTFQAGLAELSSVLAEHAGVPLTELVDHLYVRYDEQAVQHAYRLAAGLDSMVVGEPQILGQLREAYASAVRESATGPVLHALLQSALRVGKRVRAQTGIDRVGQSVVTAALEIGAKESGLATAEASVLVIGAGAMGALACATLRRAGVAKLVIANRRLDRAARLAEAYGGVAIDFTGLATAIAQADIVLSATASSGYVVSATAGPDRVWTPCSQTDRKLLLDLAVPRDIDPALGEADGVFLLDLARLGVALAGPGSAADDVAAAEAIVTEEAVGYAAWLRGAEIAPTVAALRSRADEVVAAELRRLSRRRPGLTDELHTEVARTVHRVVQQLLHQPTVRARQLAAQPGGAQYAALVRELFALEV